MVMVYDGDSVVVLDRKKSWPGLTFPGGHVEPGESFYDSAVREVREETGLTVEDLVPCGVVHWASKDGKRYISGYKDDVIAAYGFEDFAIGNSLRAGFGLSATRFDSDFNDTSSRYNNILEVFAPISSQSDAMVALVKPKIGFGRGHYRRSAGDQANKAKTKEYYYGFDSAVKHSMDLNTVVLEPSVGA